MARQATSLGVLPLLALATLARVAVALGDTALDLLKERLMIDKENGSPNIKN